MNLIDDEDNIDIHLRQFYFTDNDRITVLQSNYSSPGEWLKNIENWKPLWIMFQDMTLLNDNYITAVKKAWNDDVKNFWKSSGRWVISKFAAKHLLIYWLVQLRILKWSRVGDEVEEIKKFAFHFDTSLTKNKLQLLEYSKRVQTVCSVKPTKSWSLFHLGKNSEVQVKHAFKYLYSWRADANIDKVKFYGRKWF